MAENKKDEKSGKWRIFLVFGILLTLPVLAFIFNQVRTSWEINSCLNELRAMGYPATVEEIKSEYYKKMPEENGADIYIEASNLYKSLLFKSETNVIVMGCSPYLNKGQKFSAQNLKATDEYLDYVKQYLNLLHKAGEIKECKLESVDFIKGCEANCLQTKPGHNVLLVEELYAAEKNNPEKVIKAIKSYFALTQAHINDPISNYHYIANWQKEQCEYHLQRVLAITTFSDEQLAELDQILKKVTRGDVAKSLANSAVMDTDMIERAYKGKLKDTPIPQNINKIRYMGSQNRDILYLLRLKIAELHALKKGYPRAVEEVNKIREMPENATTFFKSFLLQQWPTTYWGSYILYEARCVAWLNAARMAIAVERYRLKNGSLPNALNDVVPLFIDKNLMDPFSGKPLIYKKLATGFAIYSVGENQIDDKCPQLRGAPFYDERDLSFILEISSSK